MSETAGLILPFKGVVPTIDNTAFIAPSASIIGDTVIGRESSIWWNVAVRGDVHEIRIGARTNIQDNSMIHVTSGKFGTYIGDDITVGHMVTLHACTLQNRSFVGMGATVMDGAVVEEGAMVAAGALVTPGKVVKSGELWAGAPAKCIRKLIDDDLAGMSKNAPHYVELAKSYLDDGIGRVGSA